VGEVGALVVAGYLVTGLAAGVLGGLIGIGGGVIVVPALTLLFGLDAQIAITASLFQMIFVSAASAYGHYKNGYILKPVVAQLVPAAALSSVAGVFLGSSVPGWALLKVFAIFLIYVSIEMGWKLISKLLKGQPPREPLTEYTPRNRWAIPAVGAPMGFASGLLGIGGGALAVPALNKFLDLPIKSAVANSSAAIFFLSIVACITKVATVHGMEVNGHVIQWHEPILVGAFLAPTSFIGGRLGAHWAKVSPTRFIQGVFVVVMLYSAWDMWKKAESRRPSRMEAPAVEAPAAPSASSAAGAAQYR